MSKEVNMTFRVEPELRADFAMAAERAHRPAAQILRDFMRWYVEQPARAERSLPKPVSPALSQAERERRQAAVSYARASVGLEGLEPDAAMEVHAARFIDGEIDLAEFLAAR